MHHIFGHAWSKLTWSMRRCTKELLDPTKLKKLKTTYCANALAGECSCVLASALVSTCLFWRAPKVRAMTIWAFQTKENTSKYTL